MQIVLMAYVLLHVDDSISTLKHTRIASRNTTWLLYLLLLHHDAALREACLDRVHNLRILFTVDV